MPRPDPSPTGRRSGCAVLSTVSAVVCALLVVLTVLGLTGH